MTVGELIREARKERGLTQKDLAIKMGVNQSHISQYENDYKSPGLDTLEKFADAIGCDLIDLLPVETLSGESLKNLPDITTQGIIDRLRDIEKDFDDIIDRGGQESVYNAILETIRFLEEQDAFPPDPDREQLLRLYERLNREGRRRALEYLEDLSGMDKYTE